ncbi:MAG: TRAP transporter small permease [Candidatus Marinimicrobia bacterium]|nr:TRAP transporter small permease [Candidatus Neomarinimicrobiota bacterium]
MKQTGKALRWFTDIIEIYLPSAVFMALFLAFLLNVFFRYILRNPQNWTFELSINAFVIVGLLGACASYRTEDHVVFDLFYTKLKPKGQNVLRIISYIIVIVFFSIAIPPSLKYLYALRAVTSIMRIPIRIIFLSFPILLISSVFRSAFRLFLDIKAFRNKTYVQQYNTQEKDLLI